jgi:hypothetical protein
LGVGAEEWAILRRAARTRTLISLGLFMMSMASVAFTMRYFNQEAYRERCFSHYETCASLCHYQGTMSYLGKRRAPGPWRSGDTPRFSELCLEKCVLQQECPDLPTESDRKLSGRPGLLDRFFF